MSAPKLREIKPNLAFKAPTYENRDSSFFSTRQGGVYYLAAAGPYLIFFALTVNKVLRAWITINIITRFSQPRKNILTHCIFKQILLLLQDLNEVNFSASRIRRGETDSKILHKLILPPV